MNAVCECTGAGYCETRGREVTSMGHRICRAGDESSIRAYFGDGVAVPGSATARVQARNGPCAYLGPALLAPDGRQVTRQCGPCGGQVRLKVFECHHPGHAADPTTTLGDKVGCIKCPDWEAKVEAADMGSLPIRLNAPADPRPGWLVLQVMITRACSEACAHCTQGSNLAGKPAMMTLEEFEVAIQSLEGFPGTIGIFGGQPTLHPKFPEFCTILKANVPFLQRGLWTNALNGHGAICKQTFNAARSNLNTHMNRAAYDEIARDWPEAIEARREHVERGLAMDSVHSAPFVAIKDVVEDEAERWKLIEQCDVNRNWSAAVGTIPSRGLRGYFCELAYAQAALHADDPDWPDLGTPIVPGWWKLPMAAFEAQVRLHCHSCGIPMRRPGILAIGGDHEEFSATHASIARPKVKGRPVEIVTISDMMGERPDRPATEYLSGVTPKART